MGESNMGGRPGVGKLVETEIAPAARNARFCRSLYRSKNCLSLISGGALR